MMLAAAVAELPTHFRVHPPAVWKELLLLYPPHPFVRRLEVLGGFPLRALRVVFGADRLIVFVHGAFARTGHIEDLAEIDARPDLGPWARDLR